MNREAEAVYSCDRDKGQPMPRSSNRTLSVAEQLRDDVAAAKFVTGRVRKAVSRIIPSFDGVSLMDESDRLFWA
jgi:hypothetical protein